MATKDILEPSLEVLGMTPYKPKKTETYMSLKMRSHFTKILTLLRKQIMEEADRTVHHMQDDAVNYADPNDRASQEEEFRLELRARDRERKLLKKIEESLQLLVNKELKKRGFSEELEKENALAEKEMKEMFEGMWPKALLKLKEICEK